MEAQALSGQEGMGVSGVIASETRQFLRVAESVVARAGELLGARIWVADEDGVVRASSDPAATGYTLDAVCPRAESSYLRMPLTLEGKRGMVIVAEPTNGETIPPRLARGLIELVANQAMVVARLPNQRELKNKFIHDLLRGPTRDEGAILREGQLLGMDLLAPRAVILIDAADYILAPDDLLGPRDSHEARVRRRTQLVIASVVAFFDLPNDTICAYIGDGEIAILKASGTHDLRAWTDEQAVAESVNTVNASWANITALKRAGAALLTRLRHDTGAAISVGIGRYHPKIWGLARSYEDARAALSIGSRLAGPNNVHCLDSLGVAAFVGLGDERTKAELAAHLLSPLDSEPELLDTLHAFFAADCSPTPTAERLCIHRNTLSYRLEKITTLTGLDPRHFDDAVQVRIALLLRSLRSTPHDG